MVMVSLNLHKKRDELYVTDCKLVAPLHIMSRAALLIVRQARNYTYTLPSHPRPRLV
jgi:hypothetical protein